MATSSIRYKDSDVFIQDGCLGNIIAAITAEVRRLVDQKHWDAEWLLNACAQWGEDYESMPPGLKDIELDDWLTSKDREAAFEQLIGRVCANLSNNDDKECKVKEKLRKVLDMLSQ